MSRWHLVEPHLAEAVEMVKRQVAAYEFTRDKVQRLHARFVAGEVEHQDDWTNWPTIRFAHERVEERDDMILFTAMFLARMKMREEAGDA